MKKTLSALLVIAMIAAMFMAITSTSSAALLPKEYVQLEYAESDGNQIIQTKIITDPKLKAECVFAIVDVDNKSGSSGVAGVFGAYWSGSKTPGRFQCGCSRSGDYFSIGLGSLLVNSSTLSKCTSDPAITFDTFKKDTAKHTVIMDAANGKITFDGKVIGQKADLGMIDVNDTENGANLAPIELFAANNATGNDQYKSNGVSASRIYSCKFYKNDKLIADFVPCSRVKDNCVGMYELVEGKFYSNALEDKSGLIAGPVVKTPDTGDNSMLIGMILAGAVALTTSVVVIRKKKENV